MQCSSTHTAVDTSEPLPCRAVLQAILLRSRRVPPNVTPAPISPLSSPRGLSVTRLSDNRGPQVHHGGSRAGAVPAAARPRVRLVLFPWRRPAPEHHPLQQICSGSSALHWKHNLKMLRVMAVVCDDAAAESTRRVCVQTQVKGWFQTAVTSGNYHEVNPRDKVWCTAFAKILCKGSRQVASQQAVGHGRVRRLVTAPAQ